MPDEEHATASGKVWRHPVRVYYEDTDAGGVVYYANHLKFAERARSALLREAGMAVSSMAAKRNLLFVVQRCSCRYVRAARLDDLLSVETRCVGVRGARLELLQNIVSEEEGGLVATLEVTLAVVDVRTQRPCRVPCDVAALFAERIDGTLTEH